MIFQRAYYSPMDRGYYGNETNDVNPSSQIQKPIVPMSELGQSVTEGSRFGTFLQSATAAIRTGAGSIELQTQMGGGGEAVGAESYGKEAREALRELARANEVKFSAIHSPVQVGNMSGFNPQQGGFSDDFRDTEMVEVKAAIKFAGDVSSGGGVVVHTGEFTRPLADADWNQQGKWAGAFKAYAEEGERAVKPLVDVRTGQLISQVRKNQIVARAEWNRAKEDKWHVDTITGERYKIRGESAPGADDGDYIDYEGNRLTRAERLPVYDRENNTFKVTRVGWEDFVKDAKEFNREKEEKLGRQLYKWEEVTPEEAFLYATTETQEKVSRGWAANYRRGLGEQMELLKKLKDVRQFYEKLESSVPAEEAWKMLRQDQTLQRFAGIGGEFVQPEYKKPTELIDSALKSIREEIFAHKELVTGQLQQAEEQAIMRDHALAVSKYGMIQSMKSYAEVGISAMEESHTNKNAKRPIFVAPENIFPEMGYGSHPDELIGLVQSARHQMVEYLTKPEIEDPSGRRDDKGNVIKIENPFFRSGMSKQQAEKEAKEHIRATFDTQHLGMWLNNFEQKPGESEAKRKERFRQWYLEQIEKVAKADVVGNIHLVDAIGGTHQHLAPGQGELPLKDAISLFKKYGYKGPITSEAHGEEKFGQGRIMVETWREFGSPIYQLGSYAPIGSGMTGPGWQQTQHAYFGKTFPPYFIFGAYAPSNDWTLWSDVPME